MISMIAALGFFSLGVVFGGIVSLILTIGGGAREEVERVRAERDEARAERDTIATLLVSTLRLARFEPHDDKESKRMDDLVENARQALREIGTVDTPSWWAQEREP